MRAECIMQRNVFNDERKIQRLFILIKVMTDSCCGQLKNEKNEAKSRHVKNKISLKKKQENAS